VNVSGKYVDAIADAAGLLLRASTKLEGGSATSARHLVARAGRLTAGVLDAPLTLSGPSTGGRIILANAVERMQQAHAAIGAGNATSALERLRSTQFGLDLLLPYGRSIT
jgi:hypothetical protein